MARNQGAPRTAAAEPASVPTPVAAPEADADSREPWEQYADEKLAASQR